MILVSTSMQTHHLNRIRSPVFPPVCCLLRLVHQWLTTISNLKNASTNHTEARRSRTRYLRKNVISIPQLPSFVCSIKDQKKKRKNPDGTWKRALGKGKNILKTTYFWVFITAFRCFLSFSSEYWSPMEKNKGCFFNQDVAVAFTTFSRKTTKV